MNRDKFPEKVPFRLTRMLIKAMEVSGIEGSYRSTCERTMSVLRDSRDSLVAMLEAFVYDPLISWRLADLSQSTESQLSGVPDGREEHRSTMGRTLGVPIEISGRSLMVDPISEEEDDLFDRDDPVFNRESNDNESSTGRSSSHEAIAANRSRSLQIYQDIQNLAANVASDSRIASITGGRSEKVGGSIAHSRLERSMRHRDMMSMLGGEQGTANEEALNEKALKVIRRVEDKLAGTDFPDCDGEPLDVSDQVQRLIVQATSSENLSQLFIGWCSFW
jgi:phosphatidylinositol kinase/protein kinase (PI-3  family)